MVNLADVKASREVVRPFHAVTWNVYLLKPRQLGLLCALTYAFLDALSQALLQQVVRGFEAHLAKDCRIPTPQTPNVAHRSIYAVLHVAADAEAHGLRWINLGQDLTVPILDFNRLTKRPGLLEQL